MAISFLGVTVSLIGLFASVLAPVFGASLFLCWAFYLRYRGRQQLVRARLLPGYLVGRIVLWLLSLLKNT